MEHHRIFYGQHAVRCLYMVREVVLHSDASNIPVIWHPNKPLAMTVPSCASLIARVPLLPTPSAKAPEQAATAPQHLTQTRELHEKDAFRLLNFLCRPLSTQSDPAAAAILFACVVFQGLFSVNTGALTILGSALRNLQQDKVASCKALSLQAWPVFMDLAPSQLEAA